MIFKRYQNTLKLLIPAYFTNILYTRYSTYKTYFKLITY